MPMQAESLEVLEGAQISAPQARAIVRAIEIEIAGAKDTLATKHDLLLQSQDSHRDTTSLREDMAKLEGSLRGDMAKLERSLRADMATLEASVRNEFAELRTTMAEWRGELRAEIQTAVSGSLRQMYMALLGQMAVLLGFAYFFATHVR
jgi:hypothetical protein